MQQNRDLSFDAFRGLAIAAVVAVHTFGTVYPDDYSVIGKWNFYFLLVYMQPLLFTVPALFFMSGYWSSKRPIESLHDYWIFLRKKLSHILIPYLFWSLIWLGYNAFRTQEIHAYKIGLALLTGGACYPYYFIIALLQLYLMTPLLYYINQRRYGLILVFALAVISLSMVYLSRVYGVIWHMPIYLPFYSWIIYYEIGFLVRAGRDEEVSYKNMYPFIILAVLISLLFSEIEAAVLVFKCNNLTYAISPVKYSTFSYSVCIIAAFLLVRKRVSRWPKLLITCGNYSFGIYLIHLPVLHQVARFVKQYKMIYSFQPLYQIIVVLLTLLTCFAIIRITRKLLPGIFCTRFLGF